MLRWYIYEGGCEDLELRFCVEGLFNELCVNVCVCEVGKNWDYL